MRTCVCLDVANALGVLRIAHKSSIGASREVELFIDWMHWPNTALPTCTRVSHGGRRTLKSWHLVPFDINYDLNGRTSVSLRCQVNGRNFPASPSPRLLAHAACCCMSLSDADRHNNIKYIMGDFLNPSSRWLCGVCAVSTETLKS